MMGLVPKEERSREREDPRTTQKDETTSVLTATRLTSLTPLCTLISKLSTPKDLMATPYPLIREEEEAGPRKM
jgi:hypothetical protein